MFTIYGGADIPKKKYSDSGRYVGIGMVYFGSRLGVMGQDGMDGWVVDSCVD